MSTDVNIADAFGKKVTRIKDAMLHNYVLNTKNEVEVKATI